jgi:hypothetical protein
VALNFNLDHIECVCWWEAQRTATLTPLPRPHRVGVLVGSAANCKADSSHHAYASAEAADVGKKGQQTCGEFKVEDLFGVVADADNTGLQLGLELGLWLGFGVRLVRISSITPTGFTLSPS